MAKSKMRKMRRSSGIRSASKIHQDKLKKKAVKLADKPTLLIPKCIGECRGCDFEKLEVRLTRISKFRGNMKLLQKLARSGSQLERGFAVMMILIDEEAPLLGVAKTPRGEVSYAMRGKVDKEILIGVQHYDDMKFGLLAYSEMVKKKNLHFYYTQDGIACSGREPNYPGEIISEIIASSNYSLSKSGDKYTCQNCRTGDVGGKLSITVRSAGMVIEMCGPCLKDRENLFSLLSGRILSKNPESDFDIGLDHSLTCISDTCSVGKLDVKTKGLIREYTIGQISDKELMERYSREVMEHIHHIRKKLLVIGGKCFEQDTEKFIDALRPSKIEKLALERVLSKVNSPVVVDSATASSVLSIFWDDMGADAIDAVVSDRGLAGKIFSETRGSGLTPSQILRDARTRKMASDALSQLPEFKNLGRLSGFADEVTKTYRAYGRDEALKILERGHGGDTKMKSLACGFHAAMGTLSGKEWLFTKEELDYGKYLSDFSRGLLDAEPEAYKEALQNLMTASGSGETV